MVVMEWFDLLRSTKIKVVKWEGLEEKPCRLNIRQVFYAEIYNKNQESINIILVILLFTNSPANDVFFNFEEF